MSSGSDYIVWVGVVWGGLVHIGWKFVWFCQGQYQIIWGTLTSLYV